MADFPIDKLINTITTSFLEVAPVVLKIVAILVVGIILSKIIGRVVVRVLKRLKFEALLEKVGFIELWKKFFGKLEPTAFIEKLVLYLGYAGTLMMLSSLMGFNGISVLFTRFFAFLPDLGIAMLMLVLGALAADFIQRIVENVASSRRDLLAPQVLGQFAYAMVLMFAILMAAGQMGLHIALLQSLLVIFFGAVTFSLMFGLSLGAQHFIGQWMAKYYITRQYELGEYIQVGEYRGMIYQFAPMVVILKTDAEHIVMPYQRILEQQVTRLTSEEVSG